VSTHHTKDKEFGLLPTVKTLDVAPQRPLTNGKNISLTTGTEYGLFLSQMARYGMLPTPSALDWNSARKKETFIKAQARHKAKGVNLQNPLKQMAVNMNPSGSTSQLNPLFVEEMMGFPKNWTTSPFLNGETNQSKHTETQ
jgi:hypothetical protein